jgi:hypothetical protein
MIVFLRIDALQVAIAAATAATFGGIIAVALYEAWLNRAWLDIHLSSTEVEGHFDKPTSRVEVTFRFEIRNRSHRPNEIVSARIVTKEPGPRVLTLDDRGFFISYVRGDAPYDERAHPKIPAPGLVELELELVIHDDWSWFGRNLVGRVELGDIHGRRYSFPINFEVPVPEPPAE